MGSQAEESKRHNDCVSLAREFSVVGREPSRESPCLS